MARTSARKKTRTGYSGKHEPEVAPARRGKQRNAGDREQLWSGEHAHRSEKADRFIMGSWRHGPSIAQ